MKHMKFESDRTVYTEVISFIIIIIIIITIIISIINFIYEAPFPKQGLQGALQNKNHVGAVRK